MEENPYEAPVDGARQRSEQGLWATLLEPTKHSTAWLLFMLFLAAAIVIAVALMSPRP